MPYPTTVDQGGVVPWVIWPGEEKTSAALTLVDNTTYLRGFEIYATTTISGFRYRGTTAAGTLDIGIYDGLGNLLTHLGVTSIIGSVVLVNLSTAYTLAPGRYFLGFWTSGAGAGNINGTSAGNENMANVGLVTATNAGGLISFAGLSALSMPANIRILCSAIVQGGLS